jgi:pimeloyl-ACP methyl ester carboxylesterase
VRDLKLVTREGVKIAYALEGSAAPRVLFIQGVGVAGCAWSPQTSVLRERFTCCSIDNRGVGASDPIPGALSIDDLVLDALAVMDALGWPDAHVVGHSMGGIVAHELAVRARTRVRSLSLLCTFLHGGQASRTTPWIVWVGMRANFGTRAMRRRAFLEMIAPRAERDEPDLDAVADRYARAFGRDLADGPRDVAMKSVRAMARHSPRDLSVLAGLPTLVLSGGEDPIALPEHGRSLAAAIPGARHVVWEGASHGLTIALADRTNAILADHFDRVGST